jgi:hypothetical protein
MDQALRTCPDVAPLRGASRTTFSRYINCENMRLGIDIAKAREEGQAELARIRSSRQVMAIAPKPSDVGSGSAPSRHLLSTRIASATHEDCGDTVELSEAGTSDGQYSDRFTHIGRRTGTEADAVVSHGRPSDALTDWLS